MARCVVRKGFKRSRDEEEISLATIRYRKVGNPLTQLTLTMAPGSEHLRNDGAGRLSACYCRV